MATIKVIDIYGQELPGIPTPALIQQGGGEAYFVPAEPGSRSGIPGVWYARAPGYESPTGEYRRVRVVTRDWPVDHEEGE